MSAVWKMDDGGLECNPVRQTRLCKKYTKVNVHRSPCVTLIPSFMWGDGALPRPTTSTTTEWTQWSIWQPPVVPVYNYGEAVVSNDSLHRVQQGRVRALLSHTVWCYRSHTSTNNGPEISLLSGGGLVSKYLVNVFFSFVNYCDWLAFLHFWLGGLCPSAQRFGRVRLSEDPVMGQ